jgi:hypothetical protein
MRKREKALSILILSIGILSLIILGTGLNQLRLNPGLPFEDLWAFLVNEFIGSLIQDYSVASEVDVGAGEFIVDIVRIVYTIALICFPLALLLTLTSKEARRRLFRTLLFMLLLTVILSNYIVNTQIEELEDFVDTGAVPPQDTDEILETTIQDEFIPSVPRWIVITLSTAFALILAIIGMVIYRLVHPKTEPYEPLPALAEQAESTLTAIENGADFRNIILHCYAEMLRIVQEQRGIQRNHAVTASEFISSLLKLGLPEDAVRQLTKLFEEVRYGSKTHSYSEEQAAVGNLQLIADAIKVNG